MAEQRTVEISQEVENPFWLFRHPPLSNQHPSVNFSIEIKPCPPDVVSGEGMLLGYKTSREESQLWFEGKPVQSW